jgi:cation transport regulator ChaC
MLKPGLLYFAYGCNMDAEFFAGVVGGPLAEGWPARLNGWRLAFKLGEAEGKPTVVANLVQDERCSTYGVVYRLPREALAPLDAFEDVPDHYRRAMLWVELCGRRARQAALVYLGQPAWVVEEGRPDSRYLGLIVHGARQHQLPPDYVDWIRLKAADEAEDCYREQCSSSGPAGCQGAL